MHAGVMPDEPEFEIDDVVRAVRSLLDKPDDTEQ